ADHEHEYDRKESHEPTNPSWGAGRHLQRGRPPPPSLPRSSAAMACPAGAPPLPARAVEECWGSGRPCLPALGSCLRASSSYRLSCHPRPSSRGRATCRANPLAASLRCVSRSIEDGHKKRQIRTTFRPSGSDLTNLLPPGKGVKRGAWAPASIARARGQKVPHTSPSEEG